MNDINITFLTSFLAGVATFISPCILPIIPGFISLIAGDSAQPLKKTFFKTLMFTLGFSVIFVVLGMSSGWLGGLVGSNKTALRYIGGTLVIIFGFHIAGFIKLGFLYKRFSVFDKMSSAAGAAGAFLVGAAFALGWTPCVGPVLASVLIFASTQGNASAGFWLLFFYSLGLAVPFLIASLFINKFLKFFDVIKKHYRTIEIVSGGILIAAGILIILDGFSIITSYILRI
ncbi:MAG: cytochrome c biogenesis protein CcdA [Endomicrobia bacterium]|nr:cytochrome c biogenesis protein CcdA [Endomicrobiia bacterium]MCL2799105.1 cytochrome c biogenesis protein CcdA [Endomicrobiia bacterium]